MTYITLSILSIVEEVHQDSAVDGEVILDDTLSTGLVMIPSDAKQYDDTNHLMIQSDVTNHLMKQDYECQPPTESLPSRDSIACEDLLPSEIPCTEVYNVEDMTLGPDGGRGGVQLIRSSIDVVSHTQYEEVNARLTDEGVIVAVQSTPDGER